MKKLPILVTAILTIISVSAFAAELPSIKLASVTPPAPIWTGLYAGLNGGYSAGTNNSTSYSQWEYGSSGLLQGVKTFTSLPLAGADIAPRSNVLNQSGILGGGQIGFNYQILNNLILGIEADLIGTSIRGHQNIYNLFSNTNSGTTPNDQGGRERVLINQGGVNTNSVSSGVDYLGTARVRLGYLITPSIMAYCTGGFAYGGVWANTSALGAVSNAITPLGGVDPGVNQIYAGGGNTSGLLTGYSVGGGLEWMIMQNWSLKVEATYWNLGSVNLFANAIAAPSIGQVENTFQAYANSSVIAGVAHINYQGIVSRAGINYHFNFANATPVVAKF